MAKRAKTIVKRVAVGALVLAVLLTAACAWYFSIYYHASEPALKAMADENGGADGVAVRELSDKTVAFVPNDPVAGLVFYPGAKVEPAAYALLLTSCAERGILCVLVEPRLNFALLDEDAADGVQEQFPQVEEWMIGGHSLGGVAATDYLARHMDEFDDVVLLAARSKEDLTGFGGEILLVRGTNDEIVNLELYEQARDNYPEDVREVTIAGGNHAYFGDYGEQDGDGTATISRDDQQRQCVDAIVELVDE